MNSTELRTNMMALNVMITKAGIIVLLVCGIVTIVFRSVLGIGLNIERYLLWSMWVLLPGAWVIGSMIARDKWRKGSYKLTEDALVVSQGGVLGGSNRQMYRYDAIIAVDVKQDVWGSRYGYGDVYLEIPRLGRHVVLRAVAEPHQQSKQLKTRVAASGKTKPLEAI